MSIIYKQKQQQQKNNLQAKQEFHFKGMCENYSDWTEAVSYVKYVIVSIFFQNE